MPRSALPVDPHASVWHLLGAALRHWRADVRAMDLRELARLAIVDHSHLAKWERGDRPAPEDAVARIDQALTAGGQLIALREVIGELERLRTAGAQGDKQGDTVVSEDAMDKTRRILLQGLSVLGIATASQSQALETIRKALEGALPIDAYRDRSAEEWHEISVEYDLSYMSTPLWTLLPDLAADMVALQQIIQAERDASTQRALYGAGARLAAIMAGVTNSLGKARESRHWWRTARHAADSFGDRDLRVWVRGSEAISGLYQGRPLQLLLDRSEEAISIAGGAASSGLAAARAGRAQVLARLGRVEDAEDELCTLRDTFSRLPADATGESSSLFTSPIHRLHHTESYVLTCTGRLGAAEDAQDRAMAAYPVSLVRSRAQVDLHRAECLVKAGDVADGVEHARKVVDVLPHEHRTRLVLAMAESVAQAVPSSEAKRPAVVEYRELLALPAPSRGDR
ncbi:helix-turn-helix domain-containing protein [Actinomadura viridis]|uniref:helix-turn-helix domain-containing protein n=1 Tax=Actinomadura viridis TaxID=58110 RepID=UPI0036971A08